MGLGWRNQVIRYPLDPHPIPTRSLLDRGLQRPERSKTVLWANLGEFCDLLGHLGPILEQLRPIWGHLGPTWGHLGAILGHLGAILAES